MTITGGWGSPGRGDYVERGEYLIKRDLSATFHGAGDNPDVTIKVKSDDDGNTAVTRMEIVSTRGWQPTNSRIAGIDFDTLVMAMLVTRAFKRDDDGYSGLLSYSTEPAPERDGPDPDLVDAMEALRNRTRRPSKITPQFLQDVADVYRQAVADGRPPVIAVQEHFNQPHQPQRQTAAGWVWQARKAGYLEPTTPGKAG